MNHATVRHNRAIGSRLSLLLLLVPLTVLVEGCTLLAAQVDSGEPERISKVAPELVTLYEEYSSYLASGKRGAFRSANSLATVIDNRVVIDAVASGDANILKMDLETQGMKQAVVFGRIVSGQLPILAIHSIAALPSLNSARMASALLHGGPRSPPATPKY
jgi:hypothetical protein